MSRCFRASVFVVAAALAHGCSPGPTLDGGLDAGTSDGAPDTAAPPIDGGRDSGICVDPDGDGDGEPSIACGGADCDDDDASRSPGHTELCDAADLDEDCEPTTFGDRDDDGDGYVDAACCNGATCGDDCDDTAPGTHPTVPEVCDLLDNDCDTRIDEATTPVPWYRDADGDDFGDPAGGMVTSCAPVDGYSTLSTDCDDTRASVNPATTEVCNGVDDNCAGGVDEGFGTTDYYPDCDGDDDGDEDAVPVAGCAVPLDRPECGALTGNWVTNDDDCDDTRESAQPGAPETCNGLDDDCDGLSDDGSAPTAWCNDPARGLHTSAATCMAGACAVVTCASPYLDCSSSAGCETDGAASVTNCSACGNTCAWGVCAGTCDPLELEAGFETACARRASGAVYCWGEGGGGAIGDGGSADRSRPGPAALSAGVVQLVAGRGNNRDDATICAVTSSGELWCWGQVGTGFFFAPSRLGDGGVLDVALGERLICWRTASSVSCELAGGSRRTFAVTDAVELAAAGTQACWRRSSGTVTCSRGTASATVDVTGLSAVALDGDGGSTSPFCAVRAGGAVACWSVPGTGAITSTDVAGATGAIGIAVGDGHACLWRANGTMACWGQNGSGQLGVATPASSTTPIEVPGLTDVLSVSAGLASTCARRRAGPFCWGDGSRGQIGNGSTGSGPTPAAVLPPP